MANTSIRLKKSGALGNIPNSLDFGELALNYADGKLFYKHANGSIASISTGSGTVTNSFATINANSSLVLATTPTDTLSIVPGNNITISTDAINKSITINADTGAATDSIARNLAQGAYDKANTDATDILVLQGVDVTQNTRLNSLETVNVNQNTSISIIQGVDVTQNTRLNSLETINTNQNTSISIIQGVDNTQNTRLNSLETVNVNQNTSITQVNQFAQGAYNLANTAITTSGGTITGSLTVTGNVTAGNIVGSSANTTVVAGAYTTTFDNSGRLTLPGSLVFSDTTTQTTAFTGSAVDSFARTTANGANGLAAGAYNLANTAITTSGGTISGNLTISQDLTVTGNLTVLGNNTILNTSQLDLEDSLIYLANGNFSSDSLDIGIIGHYNDGTQAHTGIIRDPNLKEWIFFKGYTPEVESNNLINITDPSFAHANVLAEYFKGNVIGNSVVLDGIDIRSVQDTQNSNISIIQGVNDWQNTQITYVNQFAQAAFDQANTGGGGGGGGGTSYDQSLNTTDPVVFSSVGFVDNNSKILGANTSLETSPNQIVDTFDIGEFRTMKYVIQAVDESSVHSTEVLLVHDDNDAYITEYATIQSSSNLMSISANVSSSNVNLIISPTNANTIIDFFRVSLQSARSIGFSVYGDLMSQTGTLDLMVGSGSWDENT